MYFEKIREIISKQMDIDPETVKIDSRLVDDLKADSLDIVELIMNLEQEFDVNIPDEELPNIMTISDIVRYLEKA